MTDWWWLFDYDEMLSCSVRPWLKPLCDVAYVGVGCWVFTMLGITIRAGIGTSIWGYSTLIGPGQTYIVRGCGTWVGVGSLWMTLREGHPDRPMIVERRRWCLNNKQQVRARWLAARSRPTFSADPQPLFSLAYSFSDLSVSREITSGSLALANGRQERVLATDYRSRDQ